jgi:hypothetical protein
MKNQVCVLIAFMFLLTACVSKRDPLPKLPEGAASTTVSYIAESLLRGVTGGSTFDRPTAILEVTYTMKCLVGGEPSIESRRKIAGAALQKAFKIAPVTYDNPRERGYWRSDSIRLVHKQTGCIVTDMERKTKTTNTSEILIWAIKNDALPKPKKR